MRKWKILMCLLLCSGAVFVPEYGSTKVYAEVKAADYLLRMQISRYYTEDEISDMPVKILCYAKNEIYAKHGRKFQSEELQEYFDSQPWYYGKIEPGDFSESVFNEYEKANIHYWLTKNLNCRRADMCWISRVIF